MKRTFAKALCAIALISAFAGCSKENADSFPKNTDTSSDSDKKTAIPVTLRAEQENKNRQPDSRAAIGETSEDGGTTSIVWSSDDKLSVFDGGNANKELTLYSGAGTTSGTFKGEVDTESDSYVALHPYQSAATINSDRTVISGVTLKSSQTATAGSFDPEAALMTAVEADGTLNFKNVVGYVKVTPEFDCSKISLISNSSSDVLAGTVDVTLTGSDGTPSAAASSGASDASDTVSIEGEITAGNEYYIAVLPATLSSGFRLVFTPAESAGLTVTALLRTTTKSIAIARNSSWNLGTMAGLTVGDIMLSDKSVARVADGDTLPSDLQSSAIGIVAHLYDATANTSTTTYSTLKSTLGQAPTGLVLALKNSTPSKGTDKTQTTDSLSIWATYGTTDNYCSSLDTAYTTSNDGYLAYAMILIKTGNLYTNQTTIWELAKTLRLYATSFYGGLIYNYDIDYDNTTAYTDSQMNEKKKTRPEKTTEWHLPSYCEWCDVLDHFGASTDAEHKASSGTSKSISGLAQTTVDRINVCLKKTGTGNYDTFSLSKNGTYTNNITYSSETGGYWTSTDTNATDAYNIIFDDDGSLIFASAPKKSSLRHVRCVLAF